MAKQTAKATIVNGIHVLHTDGGRKTYGITVRATGTEADVEKKGFKREWDLNARYILDTTFERLEGLLGLSRLEHVALIVAAQSKMNEEAAAEAQRFTK